MALYGLFTNLQRNHINRTEEDGWKEDGNGYGALLSSDDIGCSKPEEAQNRKGPPDDAIKVKGFLSCKGWIFSLLNYILLAKSIISFIY